MATPQTENAANQSVGRKNGWSTRESIEAALVKVGGNKTKAADLLGVSRASLRHRIAELGAQETVTAVTESPFYGLDILTPENWDKPRPCWHCGASIIPAKPNYWEQHFCNEDHRKAFHRYGHLSFDAFMTSLKLEMRREIKSLVLESLAESAVSKVQPTLVKMIRSSETDLREYVRKTVASMLENPERVRKELTGAQSQADDAGKPQCTLSRSESGGEQVGPQ